MRFRYTGCMMYATGYILPRIHGCVTISAPKLVSWINRGNDRPVGFRVPNVSLKIGLSCFITICVPCLDCHIIVATNHPFLDNRQSSGNSEKWVLSPKTGEIKLIVFFSHGFYLHKWDTPMTSTCPNMGAPWGPHESPGLIIVSWNPRFCIGEVAYEGWSSTKNEPRSALGPTFFTNPAWREILERNDHIFWSKPWRGEGLEVKHVLLCSSSCTWEVPASHSNIVIIVPLSFFAAFVEGWAFALAGFHHFKEMLWEAGGWV